MGQKASVIALRALKFKNWVGNWANNEKNYANILRTEEFVQNLTENYLRKKIKINKIKRKVSLTGQGIKFLDNYMDLAQLSQQVYRYKLFPHKLSTERKVLKIQYKRKEYGYKQKRYIRRRFFIFLKKQKRLKKNIGKFLKELKRERFFFNNNKITKNQFLNIQLRKKVYKKKKKLALSKVKISFNLNMLNILLYFYSIIYKRRKTNVYQTKFYIQQIIANYYRKKEAFFQLPKKQRRLRPYIERYNVIRRKKKKFKYSVIAKQQLQNLRNAIFEKYKLPVNIYLCNLRKNTLKDLSLKGLSKNYRNQKKTLSRQTSIKQFLRGIISGLKARNATVIGNLINFETKRTRRHRQLGMFLNSFLKQYSTFFPYINLNGVMVKLKGRLNGSIRSRTKWAKIGKMNMQTISQKINYYRTVSFSKYGTVGTSVYLMHTAQPQIQNIPSPYSALMNTYNAIPK